MRKSVIFGVMLGMMLLFVMSAKSTAQQKPQDVDSCLECHGNAAKMKEMGFPQFAVTQQEVEKQTKMPATCTGCHLGNPKDATKDGAHKGLLRLYYVKLKGFQAVTRDKLEKFKPESLEPRGKNQMIDLLPMVEKDGKLVKDPEVNTILFHDKNPRIFPSTILCRKRPAEYVIRSRWRNSRRPQWATMLNRASIRHGQTRKEDPITAGCGLWMDKRR